ncbi:MAG: cyclic nucleotide-binding domain-containing protein [Oligoflexia bacterium]|nr:cyclic nucleotide-binding domain-containing protein [Oligoflexia bacterium]
MSDAKKIPQTLRYFQKGEILFKENEHPQAMYLIKKGAVSIRKAKKRGQIEIARIFSNEVIGELSFFDKRPRSATAVALTDIEALEIRFDCLEKVYAGIPDYFKTIISSVAERLRRADNQIRKLQTEFLLDDPQLETLSVEFNTGAPSSQDGSV